MSESSKGVAHGAGVWDRYHLNKGLQSEGANAWHSQEFGDWDPCANSKVDEWHPGGGNSFVMRCTLYT